jgi:multisubunit Na+/H+ antiporter MnhF subunit
MSSWQIATVVLTAALVPCLAACVLADAMAALAAFDVASTIATTVMMVLSDGLKRQPFIDLALVLALLSLIGALAFARMMEREL